MRCRVGESPPSGAVHYNRGYDWTQYSASWTTVQWTPQLVRSPSRCGGCSSTSTAPGCSACRAFALRAATDAACGHHVCVTAVCTAFWDRRCNVKRPPCWSILCTSVRAPGDTSSRCKHAARPSTVSDSDADPAGHLGRQARRRLEHDQVRRRRDPSRPGAWQPDGPLRHLPGARQPQLRVQCAPALSCHDDHLQTGGIAHLRDTCLTEGTRLRWTRRG